MITTFIMIHFFWPLHIHIIIIIIVIYYALINRLSTRPLQADTLYHICIYIYITNLLAWVFFSEYFTTKIGPTLPQGGNSGYRMVTQVSDSQVLEPWQAGFPLPLFHYDVQRSENSCFLSLQVKIAYCALTIEASSSKGPVRVIFIVWSRQRFRVLRQPDV